MTTVFPLQHVRPSDGEEAKFIGIYSSRNAAEAALARLESRPGFNEHPASFQIDAYELDKDHWTEGFVSVED